MQICAGNEVASGGAAALIDWPHFVLEAINALTSAHVNHPEYGGLAGTHAHSLSFTGTTL